MSRWQQWTAVLMLIVAVTPALRAAAQAEKLDAVGPTPVIGIPLPVTSAYKEFGLMMRNAFEMARATVNEAGAVSPTSAARPQIPWILGRMGLQLFDLPRWRLSNANRPGQARENLATAVTSGQSVFK